MKVKPKDERTANYKSGAAVAGTRYGAAVKRAEWQEPAKDGQALYEQQMMNTEVLKRREKGISKVSDADWQNAAIKKGQPVISGRMTDAADKQAAGFEPYVSVLEAIDLPPRTADPATNVANRVTPIAVKMHEKKLSL